MTDLYFRDDRDLQSMHAGFGNVPTQLNGENNHNLSVQAFSSIGLIRSAQPLSPPAPQVEIDRRAKTFADFFNGQVLDIDIEETKS